MEFVRLFREMVMLLLVCKSSWTISVEPKYTKFMYEEQLLEKMIRLEMFVENMEKDIKKLTTDSMTAVNEIRNSTKSDLNKGVDIMDQFKSEMDSFHNDMIEWKEKVEQETSSTLEEARREVNELEKTLKAEINGLRSNITKTSSERKNEAGSMIAFNAYHVTDLSPGQHNPVVFETVLLNEGNCYDSTTGYFTATVSGIYQFNAQLCAEKGDDLEYTITVGGSNIAKGEHQTASDSDDGKCASFGAVGIVRQGQKVEIRAWSTTLFNNGDDWNSFSGVLIHPF